MAQKTKKISFFILVGLISGGVIVPITFLTTSCSLFGVKNKNWDGTNWKGHKDGTLILRDLGDNQASIESNNTYIAHNLVIPKTVVKDKVTYKIVKIEDYVFSEWTGLSGHLTIGDNMESIGAGAFKSCTNITKLTLSNSLNSIGASAFEACTNITQLTLPKSLDSIGASAFEACTHITKLTLPNSLNSIGDYAFRYCPNIESLALTQVSGITQPTYELVNGNNGQYVTNGSHHTNAFLIKSTNSGSWDGVVNATCGSAGGITTQNLTIPPTIHGDQTKAIGTRAFRGCSQITNLSLPPLPGTTEAVGIYDYAFGDCDNITTLAYSGNSSSSTRVLLIDGSGNFIYDNLPHDNVFFITSNSTNAITALSGPSGGGGLATKTLTIPNNINNYNLLYIYNNTFRDCTNITTLYLHEKNRDGTKLSIYNDVFRSCSHLNYIESDFTADPIWTGTNIFTDISSSGTVHNNSSETEPYSSSDLLNFLRSKGYCVGTGWSAE